MDQTDSRQLRRESVLVVAGLRVHGVEQEFRVKVRNLSPRGLMGEGAVQVTRGAAVQVNIDALGWVDGVVAWVQDQRFGVAFEREIDTRPLLGNGSKQEPVSRAAQI